MFSTLYPTDRQVAERFGVARETIWRWRAKGEFPRPYKLGPNMTRWRLSDIEAWESSLQMGFMPALLPEFGEPFRGPALSSALSRVPRSRRTAYNAISVSE